MSDLKKELTFCSRDLGEDVALMLCFAPPTSDVSGNHSPVAWKAATLAARGESSWVVTYTNQVGFCAARIERNYCVVSGNYTPINVGESTTLICDTAASPPAYSFTRPVPVPGARGVQASNNTGQRAAIALGLIDDSDTEHESITPILAWTDVEQGKSVSAEFTPIIRAYINVDCRESQLLGPEIAYTSPVWEGDLASLGPKTRIQITPDGYGGFVGRSSTA
ncbi:hypothetical protein OH77DRAFT_488402 [Trametes cingulata]|nr:hypothetical protein OH77DRAFT_488402 [Trametes cingulata]